jgi:hypothetical protein
MVILRTGSYLLIPNRLIVNDTRSLDCLFGCLFSSNAIKSTLLDLIGSLNIYGTADVGVCQHSKYGFNDFLYFFVGQPLFFSEHFLADESLLDVGVVNRGTELDERELEGKLLWEVEIDDELESLIGTSDGSIDEQLPMKKILLDGWGNSSL